MQPTPLDLGRGPGKLSVVICTRNRSAQLGQALEALCAAQAPARSDWEVLVILNNCTDDSAAAAARFAARLPLITASEPRTGLSHARNRALELAAGEYILWIDDDVRVHEACLIAYEQAFIDWPDASILAGPIRPVFDGSPPDWLIRALPSVGAAYASTTVERNAAAMTVEALPYGANFAVRTAIQRRYRYDPELGRGAVGWLRGGEETDVLTKILRDGGTGRWVAGAAVEHVVPPERQTVAYLWRYYEGYGRVVGIAKRRSRPRSWLVAAVDLLAITAADLRFLISRSFETPERWSARLAISAIRRGRWKAYYRP